jgi:sugar phosphate isomerase/epimerase
LRLNIGLNPYGLAYTLGLQGNGTARANPRPIGLAGFIAIAREMGTRCIELDHRWLTPMSNAALAELGRSLADMTRICSFWLAHETGETLSNAIRCTKAVGASIIRFHLTPVLEGARAALGERWGEMVSHARDTLRRESPKLADAGLTLAIEDHQDFGSEELVALVEELGPHVGITLDTGNPLAVGEDPVAFTRRAAHRIVHVHLKDYIAQFTDEGYRLIRCAIGDGCVPLAEILEVLREQTRPCAASIEPGALEARHIRLFTRDWWHGYPPRDARELAIMVGRLRGRCLDDRADHRTPWEMHASPEIVMAYERAQITRSFDNLRTLGLL